MKRNIIISDSPPQPAEQTLTQETSRNDTSQAAPSKLRQFLFKTWKPQLGWKAYILLYFGLGILLSLMIINPAFRCDCPVLCEVIIKVKRKCGRIQSSI